MKKLFAILTLLIGCNVYNVTGVLNAKEANQKPGRFFSAKMPCRLLKGITERDYSIYLPGSYDEDSLRRYPVLYLMHGGGGAHTDWERWNQLSKMADSLTSCGAIEDMVVVCPEGNQQNMMYFNASPHDDGTPDWKYEDYFFQELVPFIENNYRVRTDKGGRAIAGFSMGGGAATVYGVHHPEMFAMVYHISGYLRAQQLDFLKNDPAAAWRQRVVDAYNPILRISSGTEDEQKAWRKVDWKVAVGDQDFTLEANMDFVKALREKGIPCSMHVDEGTHDNKWVSLALVDVMKRASRNFMSLWIKNKERHIFGIISKPRQTGSRQPVAIIAHGFNGTHYSGYSYFETLNKLGYQVYAFDFPCGSLYSQSDNNTMNMSIHDEVSDLQAIVRYFKNQPDVDANNIVLIGESQGGLVSAMTAASMPNDIRAAILVFPALCIPDNWNERYPTEAEIPDTTKLWNVPLGRNFFLEARKIDVFKTIKKFKHPVLIIQGDKDPIVSMEDSRRAVKIYKDARLHLIPNAGHGFKPDEQRQSLEQISEFLRKTQ